MRRLVEIGGGERFARGANTPPFSTVRLSKRMGHPGFVALLGDGKCRVVVEGGHRAGLSTAQTIELSAPVEMTQL